MPPGDADRHGLKRLHRGTALLLAVLALNLLGSGCSSERDGELERIRSLHSAGALDQVIVSLQRLLVEDPGDAEIHFMLGQAFLQAARPKSAIAALSKSAADPEFARPAGLLLASFVFPQKPILARPPFGTGSCPQGADPSALSMAGLDDRYY